MKHAFLLFSHWCGATAARALWQPYRFAVADRPEEFEIDGYGAIDTARIATAVEEAVRNGVSIAEVLDNTREGSTE